MAADRYLPQPNQRVEVTTTEPGFDDVYFTRVEDIGQDTITIVCPMHEGEVVPLRDGMCITLTYVRDRALLTFDTYVAERVKGPVPRLRLDRPEEILRVQRRSHLRMSVRFPVKYTPVETGSDLEQEVRMYDAESVDVSAGGMRIRLIDTVVGIKSGSYVRVRFALPGNEESFDLMSQVIRIEKPVFGGDVESSSPDSVVLRAETVDEIEDARGRHRLALRFVNIGQRAQDSIVKFVFDRERELIERGVVGH